MYALRRHLLWHAKVHFTAPFLAFQLQNLAFLKKKPYTHDGDIMEKLFFERFNQAAPDFPYLAANARTINSLPHFHTELELLYLEHGELEVISLGTTYHIQSGDLCVFMPGQIHGYHASDICREYVIKIDASNSEDHIDLAAMRSDSPILHGDETLNHVLRDQLVKAVRLAQEKPAGYAFLVNSLANHIVFDLIDSGILKPFDAESSERHIKRLTFLQNVNDYISDNFSKDITLESAADHCGYSVSYFAHFFKSIAQCSFMQYLTRLRLQRAIEQLRAAPQATLSEIADNCGFRDVRAFSRAFHMHFGLTPSRYRAEYHAEE